MSFCGKVFGYKTSDKMLQTLHSLERVDSDNQKALSIENITMDFGNEVNHLDSKDLLYEKQFNFQGHNSTEYAIIQLIRDITRSFEKGEYTLGVFIDLSKAFDTLDHQILIRKLQYYGIDGTALEWFKSCLSNRK